MGSGDGGGETGAACCPAERDHRCPQNPVGRWSVRAALHEFVRDKYSDERYDPDKWFFPGTAQVDGTLEGGMQTGMAATHPDRGGGKRSRAAQLPAVSEC